MEQFIILCVMLQLIRAMLNIRKDYLDRALNHEIILTKFLDLEELRQINTLKNSLIKVCLEGGYEDAERKRAIICSKDEEIFFEDFKINAYEIILESDFKTINHRHLLGTLMSLGINRNSFGDILLSSGHIYLFVSQEIAKYIEQNFKYVNHTPLKLIPIKNLSDIVQSPIIEQEINISSMRLDAIVARTLNKSRNDASELITKGLVMINHKECLNTSYNVKLNDIISIRHFGRIEIIDFVKTTKKDRLIIKIGVKH